MYWFCHTSTWIHHMYTRVPHPEPPSLLPPHTIPLGRPSAPAPSIQYHALNLDWWFISYMILYMFQCHSPKSSHPLPLPQSPVQSSFVLRLILTMEFPEQLLNFSKHIFVLCQAFITVLGEVKWRREVAQSCWTLATPWTVSTRLLGPWDFPGMNTGVGCHFLLQGDLPDPGIEPRSPAL